jgi:hypothetical protein
MSLQSLLALYGNPGNQFAQAVTDGDEVAKTRMRKELAQAIKDEIVPAASDRSITALELNRSIEAFSIILPGQPAFATTVAPPATIPVTAKIKMGIQRMVNHIHILGSSLSQLRGEFPTAAGVTDPAAAIFPGTKVWVVFEFSSTYINQRAEVVTDNGDDPVTIATIGLVGADPSYDIPRHHVWFEYQEGETDLVTAEFMDTLEVGDDMTDGVDTWPIDSINYTTRLVVLDDGSPSGLELSFEDLQTSWTEVP